eukprot:scaffold122010_cov57-Phaeocystis_antarctica.AAC.5
MTVTVDIPLSMCIYADLLDEGEQQARTTLALALPFGLPFGLPLGLSLGLALWCAPPRPRPRRRLGVCEASLAQAEVHAPPPARVPAALPAVEGHQAGELVER